MEGVIDRYPEGLPLAHRTCHGTISATEYANGLKKGIGAQSNITQRNSFGEVRRIVIDNSGKSSMHPRRDIFRALPSILRISGRERCRHVECGRTQKQFHVTAGPSNFRPPEATKQMSPHEEPNGGERNEDNARLLAQMPASRVPKKPCGYGRQERKDAVSGQEDGNRGAGNTLARQQDRTERRSSAFSGKSQCVDEQRKSCISYRLTNFATLPTANAEVTRT